MSSNVANLGFEHFIAQSDSITLFLFLILIIMSMISWVIIFLKSLQALFDNIKIKRFLNQYHQVENLKDASQLVTLPKQGCVYITLLQSGLISEKRYEEKMGTKSSDGQEKEAFLASVLRTKLDEIQLISENGTSALATIAATAPFVGLFGTVWGIYHALIEIGSTGAGTIDKVAGPVGEALIMTGVGLAVAIPAVIAYNWISRRNRLKMGRLDSYAFELLLFLKTGSRFSP